MLCLFLSFTCPQAKAACLWGAVGLTKVVLPSMLDRQGGHVVAFGGDTYLSAPPEVRVDTSKITTSMCRSCGLALLFLFPGVFEACMSHERKDNASRT